MRTLVMLALAATTAAARVAREIGSPGTTMAQRDVPLEAHLLRATTGYFELNLSEKAYMAVFSIPAEGGTPTLVYPWSSNSSPEPAGERLLRFQGPLANDRIDATAGGTYTTTLVLIASRTPLNLDSYGQHRARLVEALGGYTLASSRDSQLMTDRLVHLVASPGTAVTVDSYIFHQ